MATRDIVPRADGEGQIGTTEKAWLSGHFKTLYTQKIENDSSGDTPDYCLSSYASWADAISTISTTTARLIVDTDATVSADSTSPSTLMIKVYPGCVITVNTTKTLTINGVFEAGLYQVFSCTGSGKVVFDSIPEVHPEWWYSSGDYYTALQAAITTGMKVSLVDSKTYSVGTGLSVVTNGQIIEGGGIGSVIKATGAIELLTISSDARKFIIQNCKLDGDSTGTKGVVGQFPDGTIQDCWITGFTTSGVSLETLSGFSWKILNNRIIDNPGDGITLSGYANAVMIKNNIISGSGQYGVQITSAEAYPKGIFISGNDMENNCTSGSASPSYAHIYAAGGCGHVRIDSNYFESDIDQTGYASQLLIEIGAGCESVSIQNNYLTCAVATPLDYLVSLGSACASVIVTDNWFAGYGTYAILNSIGVSGQLTVGNNHATNQDTIFSSFGREVSFIPWMGLTGLRLTRIQTSLDLSSAAKAFVIFTVPTTSSFLPISVVARVDNDIAATTGEYWAVGINTNNRRTDFGVCSDAAASSKHSQNAKILWLNSSELANQIVPEEADISLISVADTTDGAALGNNIGGAAGDTVTVIIYGWLIRELLDL